ncbi:MAG: bifunctional (p)ppGpp synthetase/guanosine-3',5'-bis(diphosphate) 3'-pyrophosphohydrolase [Bacteroidetes bacterium]|nr:bifunctional (p)ppGpp synthetase/guanosine-3',5'-bis(diphosphate) 3'-pyrophosphohydrolase [Bacteroidota bacterium]
MHLEEFKYNQTYLKRSEMEMLLLERGFAATDVNLAVGAYDMAESVHEGQKRHDGTPYFWHPSRVAKIVILELEIKDIQVICAALLHDVLEDSLVITGDVIKYNFGEYCSQLVQLLTKDIKAEGMMREMLEKEYVDRIKAASVDAKILKLCDRLDSFRCLAFNVKKNPIKYIIETTKFYFPLGQGSGDARLEYLIKELQAARNKFLG